VLDVPWVVLNTKYGIYQGIKTVRGNGAMAAAWIVIIMLNALLITSVVRYSQKRHTPLEVFFIGAFVGFVSYSTFNGTIVNIMQKWSFKMALIDTVWGVLLYGGAASLASLAFHPWVQTTENLGCCGQPR